MDRREFIGGAALSLAAPLAAEAQPKGKDPRIGFLQAFNSENVVAFMQGLRELGYIEGQTAVVETRFYSTMLDRLPQLANELAQLKCDVNIQRALAECFRCVRRGGGCLISMRDYESPPPRYDLSFEITPTDGAEAGAIVLKTGYLAIPVEQVAGLMRTVGFEKVGRVDGRFFQPVLVGTRPVV